MTFRPSGKGSLGTAMGTEGDRVKGSSRGLIVQQSGYWTWFNVDMNSGQHTV
jgi:hypothetical protein